MTSPSTSRSATREDDEQLSGLRGFLDSSPTPHHVVETAARRLVESGFVRYDPSDDLPDLSRTSSRGFVTRGGALIAFVATRSPSHHFRVVGAHTDSPGLHVKPNPEGSAVNVATLEVEIYGSPLLNSWLDRDLDLAGHVIRRDGSSVLFRSEHPVARLAQLAVHLDRNVNESGLVLDKHAHLRPIWGSGEARHTIRQLAADFAGVPERDIAVVHAMLADHAGAAVIGSDRSLLASGRLDNQLSCWAAVEAISSLAEPSGVAIAALFDHEEVGSASVTGAAGPMLEHLLERLAVCLGLSRSDYLSMLPRSSCLSCDNAHAVHPNYQERHDPKHGPVVNGGVALKSNVNQRYATSPQSVVAFLSACEAAGVRSQSFVSRNNMPCGSTIGPITATRLGIDTVDVGVPQLSMHSAREVCGVDDALDLPSIVREFLRG